MITSTANAKVKNIIKCKKSAKERKKQKVFLVEGLRMFLEIPKQLHLETYMTEDFYKENQHMISLDFLSQVELVAPHVLEAMTDTKTPQGVISLVKQPCYSVEQVCSGKESPLILALENLQDPGNLGTILRTAEGAGVTGVLLSRDTVDIYNPKVVRSTMGSIFRVPFCYVEDLTATIRSLNEECYGSYSAHLQGKSFYDYSYKDATIFCVGNEGNGLSKELSETTKHKIKIPMMGKVESLNAATAATVLMYEAMRQRMTEVRQK